MVMKRYKFLIVLFPAFLIFISGCVDVPKDLVMPKWDVSLNVPIANKTYTLWDAIKKDTSKLKYYRSGTNLGLLYYSDIKKIEKITVGDNLSVDAFTTNSSVQIGSISIPNPQPVIAKIKPVDLGLPNATVPFPAVSNNVVTVNFDQSQQFSRVVVQSGTLNFKVTNYFPSPVTIAVNRVTIKNVSDNSIIIDDNRGYALTPGASRDSSYSLAGKIVNGFIKIEVTMSTVGSGAEAIALNDDTNLTFSAQVQNFLFNEVNAKIAQNTFTLNDSFIFDDSTYVQNAVIERGSLTITANSNLDLDLTATLTIPSLKNSSGGNFTQIITLGRKEKNKVIQIPSLNNYTLSDPSGGLVNSVQYTLTVTSTATNDFRTIYKTDDVYAKLDISNLYFRSFTGRIKPTNLTVNETTIDLNMGDVSDKLLVNQIDLENPQIQLKLRKSTNVQVNFTGQLIGRSATHTAQLNIPATTIGTGETVITLNSTDVRNFIKSFSGRLPQTVTVKGQGKVNPLYTVATLASADSVYGTAELTFPMKVSVTGGSFRDSSNVDLSDNDRTEMRKVLGGSLILEIQNGIAFDASVSARLYDASNRFLMNLPPNRTPNDTLIHVQAATVNSQGKVTAPATSNITFTINQADVDKIIQSKYIISKINFYTSGNNNLPVEFKTSDAIRIKAYGSLNYQVEEKK